MASERNERRADRPAGDCRRQLVYAVRARACAPSRDRAASQAMDRTRRLLRRRIQHDRHRRRHRHGSRRHALLAAVARPDRRQRRVHVQRAQGGRDGLHIELRQDHAGHADGRHAAEHTDRFRLGRADGGGTHGREQLRPDRRDGQGSRRELSGQGARRAGACGLPYLRVVLGYVHGQLDELPDRSARAVAAGQRHGLGDARGAHGAVPQGGQADREKRAGILFRRQRRGAAALDRHAGGLSERHVDGHRHGRLVEHGAAPAGRRSGGGRGLHDERHRPPVAPHPRHLQGSAQLALPHTGRQPGRRHSLHLGRTEPGGTDRHGGRTSGLRDARRSDPTERPAKSRRVRRSESPRTGRAGRKA